MAAAMLYPEAEKGGRGKNSKLNLEFSSMSLSQARTVLRHLPQRAQAVGASRAAKYSLPAEAERAKARKEKGRPKDHMIKKAYDIRGTAREIIGKQALLTINNGSPYSSRRRSPRNRS